MRKELNQFEKMAISGGAVFYLCDGEACMEHKGRHGISCWKHGKERFRADGCKHTTDINHAVNFHRHENGSYWETADIHGMT